jgi:hypothetical protein
MRIELDNNRNALYLYVSDAVWERDVTRNFKIEEGVYLGVDDDNRPLRLLFVPSDAFQDFLRRNGGRFPLPDHYEESDLEAMLEVGLPLGIASLDINRPLSLPPQEVPASDEARDSLKFGFESVKHLTTLSSGAIVLIGSFSKGVLPTTPSGQLSLHPSGLKWLLLVSFVLLLLSTILAAYTSFWHINLMRDLGNYHSPKLYQQGRQRTALYLTAHFTVVGLLGDSQHARNNLGRLGR